MDSSELNPQNQIELSDQLDEQNTPPNYVSLRNKRPRETETSPSEFARFKEEIKELISTLMRNQSQKIEEITDSLKEIKHTNSNIETSISLLTSQNEDFCRKIEALEQQAKRDMEYISILEERIEDLQRSSRKSSIELKNVPRKQNECRSDLMNMITNLAKTVKVDMCSRDIKDIFRLKTRKESEKTPPIIIELSSTLIKTDLLKKTKEFNSKNKTKLQAKHLGLTIKEDTPVFISELLTAKGARLHFLSRDLVKSKKYKYCWTSFGKVFVRKDDNSKIILIQSESQIHDLLQER
ncbi:hypothetical protein ABMA27_010701 [Loxostege sticticalis]|uniref:FP protein C-terminal domain-containing protein n=1 Tax=Loxostege sticticalis TaxID=481309 RepID=A0ABR3H4F5_LOXSC